MPRSRPVLRVSSSQRAVAVPRKRIAELARFVAARQRARLAEVDLAVVGAGEIAALNRRYLSHGGATDVLSFDMSEGGGKGIAAQIIVCGDIAARRAEAMGCSAQRELMLYVVHGLLHLMGHEDATVRGAAKMHAREDELLDEFLGRRPRRTARRTRKTKRRSR